MTNAVVYGNSASFRTQKVLIAAKAVDKKVEVKDASPPKDKFALQLTPAYDDGQVRLSTTGAIAKHIASTNQTYVPKDPSVDMWLLWAEGELLPNILAYVLPSISLVHIDNEAIETAKKELLAQLQQLDKYLLTKTFLVGERLSVADVDVALDLVAAYQHVFDEKVQKQLVNVTRWFNTVVHQKVVKEVVGEIQLATKVSTFNLENYKKNTASQQPKKDDKKHDKKKDDSAKKDSKPAAKKPEAEEPEEELSLEPKFTDPFAQFPSSKKFDVDLFKRVYSNEDPVKSIPHFWEHFDPENYSLWYCEYKYPEELSLVFMSCNLITGMFQRLDKMRKHAFGSVCLFGKDNASTISGVWFWRGPKLAFELCPDWQIDYESYEWKKLDPNAESTKKLVNAYWAWEGFEGKKEFNQGKIFK